MWWSATLPNIGDGEYGITAFGIDPPIYRLALFYNSFASSHRALCYKIVIVAYHLQVTLPLHPNSPQSGRMAGCEACEKSMALAPLGRIARSTDQTKRNTGQEEHKMNRKLANRELQDLRGKLNRGRTEFSNDARQGRNCKWKASRPSVREYMHLSLEGPSAIAMLE
ncbi:hypothetical protein K438DRAFT_1775436 [Mycena galopus ATCC 62051]|nr:hypothetical protein K438DRAFT_1775436 [Mycena galopus ATCC 62051]